VLLVSERKYAPGDMVFEGLEKEAREAEKGLWADPAAIPPWIYRKKRREKQVTWNFGSPNGRLLAKLLNRSIEMGQWSALPANRCCFK
jgi:hypothetical protein